MAAVMAEVVTSAPLTVAVSKKVPEFGKEFLAVENWARASPTFFCCSGTGRGGRLRGPS